MDLNKLFKRLFPTREWFDDYMLWRKQRDDEAVRQTRIQKQIDDRRAEMENMTTDHEDDDFADEADDIWKAIKGETG